MSLVQPTRVLVVGAGGREHALAWKLAAEPGVNDVIVAPGSAAMTGEPRVRCVPGIDPLDGDAVVGTARAYAAELVVIGPEAPLAAGVADDLRAAGIAVFGPSRSAARIESSKAFCREVAEAAGVPMAHGRAFDDPQAAVAFATELAAEGRGVVVKADGLAGGKGVTVADDAAAAADAIRSLFAAPTGATNRSTAAATTGATTVVVEERLTGHEASLVALADGRDVIGLPPARDHKRLLDGDLGPNTGGMGAYSPLPDLSDGDAESLLDTIHRPILAELARRGSPFRGALYAGLMLTDRGPVLLECNARFGDPETQVVLPRLAVALGPLLLAAARGELRSAARPLGLSGSLLPVTRDATVGLVLAAPGYPERPTVGASIGGLEEATRRGALVFHAGTTRTGDGYRTAGGRVITVVGRGPDLAAARELADHAADAVSWDGLQRRHDISADIPVHPRRLPQPVG